jgi:hypothetical protein
MLGRAARDRDKRNAGRERMGTALITHLQAGCTSVVLFAPENSTRAGHCPAARSYFGVISTSLLVSRINGQSGFQFCSALDFARNSICAIPLGLGLSLVL